MEFDYFYGQQAEQFSFYRIPKMLFTDDRFWNVSTDAKLLYGILLDRMNGEWKQYYDYFREQLEFDILLSRYPYDHNLLNSILDLIVETVCTRRKLIRIASDDKPAEIVKSRFMKLESDHICFVIDCFKENKTDVRNVKQYLLAAIYNAPLTIDPFYTAKVSHDMSEGFFR